MHNMPGHPQGHLLLRDGAAMASSDNVTITLEGVGGHGAMPHCAADPVVAGAAIVMGLQSIVARNVDPLHMSVITVGAFNAGKANNVIPQTATLASSACARWTATCATCWKTASPSWSTTRPPATRCAPPSTTSARLSGVGQHRRRNRFRAPGGAGTGGRGQVVPQTRPLTGSEDFAFMLEEVPGSYLLVGNGDGSPDGFNSGHGACMVHNPGYDFNDHSLPVGAAYCC